MEGMAVGMMGIMEGMMGEGTMGEEEGISKGSRLSYLLRYLPCLKFDRVRVKGGRK